MDYSKLNCPFCLANLKSEIIAENEFSYAIYDIYPVSNGHILIITKHHIENFFETTIEEKTSIFDLMDKLKISIDNIFKPDGYNVGININSTAGQTIPHVHVHLIPRYNGDVENPRGGVRYVIPEKGNY
jgi:diadenosine tetraphosphate (Ap4A) HIT family hydrolase